MRFPILLASLCAGFLGLQPLAAGEVATKEIVETQAEPAPKDWGFTLALYSWVPAVDGKVGIGRLTANTHVSMKQVIERLDMAYMGYLEARYQRWGLGVDALYSEFSGSAGYHYGPLSGSLKVKLTQVMVTPRVFYRVVDLPAVSLDLLAGFRWTSLSTDMDLYGKLDFKNPYLAPFNREFHRHNHESRGWVDPIFGLRGVANLTSRWYLNVEGDIGGFGVSSKLTWQAMGGIGFRFTEHVSAYAAYRALGLDYDRKGLKIDTVSHGPLLALVFSF